MKSIVYVIAFIFLLLFLYFLLAGTDKCHAGTNPQGMLLRVPQEYPTIQAAINAAQNSDTVLVSEGTYHENIQYKGKGVVVTSRYFITKDWQTVFSTVIDGSTCANKDTASTVLFLESEDSTAVLDGFTITGGTGTRHIGVMTVQEGAGIFLSYSSAIIRNNYIVKNTIMPQAGVNNGGGGGISSYYGNPGIYNNIIVSNTAGYAGGIVLNWSRGKIRNNVVYHNTATLQWGCGGIMVWQAPQNGGIVENNTIVGNISLADAGGISISVTDATTIPVVRNNIIWGNRQVTGGQVISPEYIMYNNVEDYSAGTNISVVPQLQEGPFLLSSSSPCVDAGDPVVSCNDAEDLSSPGMALQPSKGTVRNDMGAYGGAQAKVFPSLDISGLHVSSAALSIQCVPGQQAVFGIEMLNLSSKGLTVDSVTHTNRSLFSLNKNFAGQIFSLFGSDSIKVAFSSPTRGRFSDTVTVFYKISGKSSSTQIAITGISNTTPYLNRPIPAQRANVGQLFVFQIPDSTFLDADSGDTLAYQATGLPTWLSFNPETHSFQGTPTQTTDFPLYIGITVRDLLQAGVSTNLSLSVQQPTRVDDSEALPSEYELCQNYPNPFNPSTEIGFRVSGLGFVSLKVFDAMGREVATLVNERRAPGSYSVRFDANGLVSGVYFYRLQAGSFVETKKLMVLR
jgi:hypothetical protein